MHELNGRWTGEYTYGEGYPSDMSSQVISFEMELNFDGHQLKGSCTDDETQDLFSGPSTIEGSFDDDFVSFVKKYPCRVEWDDENNPILNPGETSFPIHYTGTFHNDTLTGHLQFEGEWEVTAVINNKDGSRDYHTGMGYWTMVKIV